MELFSGSSALVQQFRLRWLDFTSQMQRMKRSQP